MNYEDFLLPPPKITTEKWQIGAKISDSIPDGGIALVWLSDFRGIGGGAELIDFTGHREFFYRLSALDFDLPLADLGDLVSGKTPEDTHYILQEILAACFRKNTVPVVVGGDAALAYQLFSALNFFQQNITYTQISNVLSLSAEGQDISNENFLGKLLSSKNFSLKNYFHLGYQKHLNDPQTIRLLQEVDFEAVRLAEMMGDTEQMEPYFRHADVVTVNCDAVESFAGEFSVNPQVNGLNRREICAYMKEAGLSENLKSVGIFNFNFKNKDKLSAQLLAQMIWYLVEGINIRRTHPREKNFETFWVMDCERQFAFQRDVFSNLWYFGEGEDKDALVPCARKDYEEAKKGFINPRFLK